MEVRNVHPNRTLIELSPEELHELTRALSKLSDSFTLMSPMIKDLARALREAAPNLKQTFDRLQRLDPAFSGPALEGDAQHGFTANYDDPELGGVRPVPTAEDYRRAAEAEANRSSGKESD